MDMTALHLAYMFSVATWYVDEIEHHHVYIHEIDFDVQYRQIYRTFLITLKIIRFTNHIFKLYRILNVLFLSIRITTLCQKFLIEMGNVGYIDRSQIAGVL